MRCEDVCNNREYLVAIHHGRLYDFRNRKVARDICTISRQRNLLHKTPTTTGIVGIAAHHVVDLIPAVRTINFPI